MTNNADAPQDDLLDTSAKNIGLEDEISNKLIVPSLEELLKPLISSIERMKAEATNASYSFEANTKEVIASIQNTKQSINKVIDIMNVPLKELNENGEALKSTVKILALLPNKIDDRLAKLPYNFSQALNDYIPEIAEKLNSTLEQSIEQLMHRVEESCKATSMENEKSTTELVTIFKAEISELSQQFKEDTLLYKTELEQIIDISSKERVRKFVLTLVTVGAFSAIVSGVTSWVINKYFPRSVEIIGNHHLIVKDSQVLVHGSDTYKLEK